MWPRDVALAPLRLLLTRGASALTSLLIRTSYDFTPSVP